MMQEHEKMAGRKGLPFDAKKFAEYDAGLICANHDDAQYGAIALSCDLVIDACTTMRNQAHTDIVLA
jgi:hypothetical protein